ncbi:MAG: Hsp20/alpha crystallin family protein [Bernardetiaceae bacterium]|nr:Hsp20/alpha crystallin family protein [Bernardetiaceae bacterium]
MIPIKGSFRNPSILDGVFSSLTDLVQNSNGLSHAAVNIVENEDHTFSIMLAAPGLVREDFEVELNKNILSVSVNKKANPTVRFTHREYSFQQFKRVFGLPDEADGDAITANYNQGILHIHIPLKNKKQGATRSVEVK